MAAAGTQVPVTWELGLDDLSKPFQLRRSLNELSWEIVPKCQKQIQSEGGMHYLSTPMTLHAEGVTTECNTWQSLDLKPHLLSSTCQHLGSHQMEAKRGDMGKPL